jgi:hypothetical protein
MTTASLVVSTQTPNHPMQRTASQRACARWTLGARVTFRGSTSFRQEATMEDITGDMKVADVLHRCPEAVDVFLSRGCPDMRQGFFSLMARLMSVRNAARIHKIDLARLLADLNKVARGAARRPQ